MLAIKGLGFMWTELRSTYEINLLFPGTDVCVLRVGVKNKHVHRLDFVLEVSTPLTYRFEIIIRIITQVRDNH